MKIMKIIPILAMLLLSLASCVEEELANNRVLEGVPTLMKLSLEASFRNDTPQSRAESSELDENKFSNVRVMVFNSSGKIVTNDKQEYFSPESKPTMNINTLSGNGCSVYIIANTAEGLDNELMFVKSLTELNEVKITAAGLGLELRNKPLLMTGIMKNIDIDPGTSVVVNPIKMEYVSAKLTLKIVDATPDDHDVALLGWDVENASLNTYLILNGGSTTLQKDANDNLIDEDNAWGNTFDELMSFDKTEGDVVYLTQYLLENRRGGRVEKTPIPTDRYPDMNIDDEDHRGKRFFAPPRATCIVIHAIHKSPKESRVLEARIFIGNDNHSDYNIGRGNNYEFAVTVKGIDDITIDTNLETSIGTFAVHISSPLDKMDSHPDFRPIQINASNGIATIEVLDEQGHSYNEPGFDATWVKVSPLDLMYHQVKQSVGDWQQEGISGSLVRPKYIPHKSVREILAGKGGWNLPTVEDDDTLSLAEATYRMCYKITDISFPESGSVNKQLYIYIDDYNVEEVARQAKIKITFHPEGSPLELEEKIYTIIQHGYMKIYDGSGEGLTVLNEDGKLSGETRRFGVEQFEESHISMYTGLPSQGHLTMQWGFNGTLLYNAADKYRNGYFLTANAVYSDVSRQDNDPADFGHIYRPKYSDGHEKPLAEPYLGAHSGKPYYIPPLSEPIYHPIYNSSAARYCHEKNRDLNGDGLIDDSETIWYLPSQHELMVVWISNIIERNDYNTAFYLSATEYDSDRSCFLNFRDGSTQMGVSSSNEINFKKHMANVRCVRKLWQ